MRIFSKIKFLALPLALVLSGCDFTGLTPAYQTKDPVYQTEILPKNGQITVSKETTNLVITNARGKTIYMARTNPENYKMDKNKSRMVRIISGASREAGILENTEKSTESENFCLAAFESEPEYDPHRKIYEAFLENLKNTQDSSSLVSRSISYNQSFPKNYAVGDTETFYSMTPESLKKDPLVPQSYEYILLVSEDEYNIWVQKDDVYYSKYEETFRKEAEKLGKNFINGYGLVKHLYGEPSDKIYYANGRIPYGNMAESSKTGTKINILLYAILDVAQVYGFVYHGDNYHGTKGSNEGRFLYMDSKTLIETPVAASDTALHEFSHTISYNQKTLKNGRQWTYWYGELLAMICEDMMQDYLGIEHDDVNGNLMYTPKARLSGANFAIWQNGITGNNTAAYAATFQFGAWLTRNFGGAKFIKELATNQYVDMESVLNAVNKMGVTQYTQTSLLQEFAGALLVEEEGKGLNQDAKTYSGSEEYTCTYTDSNGTQQTYLYPVSKINLWDNFYGWCNTDQSLEKYIANKRIFFSSLPEANIYKRAEWTPEVPDYAYLGPCLFNYGTLYADIGPYSSILFKIGYITSDTAELEISSVGTSTADVITIYVK